MTGAEVTIESVGRGEVRRRPAFTAEVVADWSAARPRWARLTGHGTALAFQQVPWLDAWYGHCDGLPTIVFLKDEVDGGDRLGLPLVRFREGGKRVIAFADGGLTDYNAPAVALDGEPSVDDGARIWRALRAALPTADLLRFEKMPVTILGRPNPLASLPGGAPSSLIGNILHVPGT